MKPKIFSPVLLALMCLVVTSGAFAQQKGKPDTSADATSYSSSSTFDDNLTNNQAYREKMRKLNAQMHELQTQINSVRTEQLKKSSLAMRESARKVSKGFEKLKNLNYSYDSNVSGESKNLGVTVSTSVITVDNDTYVNSKVQSGDAKEKIKNYSKSYSIDRDDVIQIDNKFGKIVVNTWAKNEVKVDVQIKADADEEDDAQKLIDGVTISDSKDGAGVSFRTNIERDNDGGNWGNWFSSGKNHIRKIEVNYTVYMPAKSPLTITNRYGSTELPDLSGKVVINNSYGSLVAKSLTNAGNEIKVRYGSAKIETLIGSDVNVAYGSLSIGECDKLNADVSYGSAKIGKLTTSGTINARFSGTVEVGDVGKNVTSLSVNSSYSGIRLGLSNDQNADFDVSIHYGSFSYGGVPVTITSKTPEDGERGFNPTKTYKGKVGKGNSDKVISIKSTFGSVKFD